MANEITPVEEQPSEERHNQLLALATSRALSVDALDELGIIQALIYHYNKYRGIKAFLLDIDQNTVAYKGISSYIVATSPDAIEHAEDQINALKDWIVEKIKELNNPNLTLVISCLGSQLYRFSDVIDRADPPLANIDFAPLHEFDEVVADARLKYDMILIRQGEQPKLLSDEMYDRLTTGLDEPEEEFDEDEDEDEQPINPPTD